MGSSAVIRQSLALRMLLVAIFLAAAAAFVHVHSDLRGSLVARPRMATRSKEDMGLSKKALFQKLKRKLEEAVKVPGFLEQETPPDITLYCRGNKDGSQLIACPHTQFIQMLLRKKGLRYSLRLIADGQQPAWMASKRLGSLPVLEHQSSTFADPIEMAEYIDRTFPHNSLTRQGIWSYQEILEKTSGFFPAVVSYARNDDPQKDGVLQERVESQLDELDTLLRSAPGRYLCGVELTLADLYLLPQLFQAHVILDKFKDFEFYHLQSDPTRIALETYIARMLAMEDFNRKKIYYTADQVVFAWKNKLVG